MRYLLILAVILVSLCAGLPEIPFINPGNTSVQQAGLLIIDAESPDAFVRVDFQPEIKTGRSENILFDIENKNNFNLENVDLTIYDPCVFTGDTTKNIGEIKANRSATFSLKLTAGNTDLDKDCDVKFKLSYNTEYSLFQDIAVLSQSEYEQREAAGTLNNIPIQSSSPSSPFKISLSFSGKQPFITDENYRINLDYYNIGNGVLEVKNITIINPENLKDFSCNDYKSTTINCMPIRECVPIPTDSEVIEQCELGAMTCTWFIEETDCKNQAGCYWDGTVCRGTATQCSSINDRQTCNKQIGCEWSNFYLTRSLNFIGNRATGSSCSFTTTTIQPLDIKSLTITASYKYVLYNSILIKVKRK
jgi:hypothetical protein